MKWIFILKIVSLFLICSGMNYAKASCEAESAQENTCANNKEEVLASSSIMCKLEQLNGNADSLFRTFVDKSSEMMNTMIAAQITVKEDGQYEVTSNLFSTSGNGQICLEDGKIVLKAGEMQVFISDLNKIEHQLPLGLKDANGVEQVLALELEPVADQEDEAVQK